MHITGTVTRIIKGLFGPSTERIRVDLTIRSEASPRPGRLTLANVRSVGMTKYGYVFTLPMVGASDVAKRELSVAVDNNPPTTTEIIGQLQTTPEMLFDLNANVSLVLTDVDGSGNRSQPSAPFTFTVTDTVPPPQPGAIGIASVTQVEV